MNLKLVLLSQAKCDTTEFNLGESSYSIGRKQDNELRIEEFCVSEYHAEVYRTEEGDYEVTDLDSSEGTFLNRKQVTSPMKIKAGDVLKFGLIKVGVHEHKGALPSTSRRAGSDDGIIRFDEEPLVEEENPETVEEGASTGDLAESLEELKASREAALEEAARLRKELSAARKKSGRKNTEKEIGDLEYSLEAEKLLTDAVKGKNKEFRSKIQLLTTDLGNAQEEINRLKASQARQTPAPKDLGDNEAKFAQLKEELALSHDDKADLQSELTDLQIELASLRGELTNREIELLEKEQSDAQAKSAQESQLREEIEELKAKLSESESNSDHLEVSRPLEELQRRLEAAEKSARSSVQRELGLKQTNEELVEQLKKAESTASELEAQMQEDASSDSRSAERTKELREKLKEAESRAKSAESLQEELAAVQEEKLAAEAEREELREKIASAETEIEQVRQDLEVSRDQNSDVDVLLSAKSNLASEQAATIEELRAELAKSKRKFTASEKKLMETHRKERAALEKDLQSSEDKSNQRQEQLESLQSELTRLRENNAEERTRQTREQEAKLTQLEEDFAQSVTLRTEIESAQDELKDQLGEREKRIADLTESTGELESRIEESEKEKGEISTLLQLTREGLSDALHSTRTTLARTTEELEAEIVRRVKVETLLQKSEEARKGLRSEIEALEAESDEGVVLSSEETSLPRSQHLTEKQEEEVRAFEERMASLHPSRDADSEKKEGFSEVEFYRVLVEKLDLIDDLIRSHDNKRRFAKIVKQLVFLKGSFLELLESQSVDLLELEPGTPLCMNQGNRLELVPLPDGSEPKIDPFGNTAVVETVCPGYIFHDGTRDLIIRKATVKVG